MAEHLTHDFNPAQFAQFLKAIDSEWLRHLLYQILTNQEIQMSALANAQAALAQLQTDVAALVAKQGGVAEADVQALADTANAIDASIPKT